MVMLLAFKKLKLGSDSISARRYPFSHAADVSGQDENVMPVMI